MSPENVFAKGSFVDSPEGINLTNSGKTLLWVAKRGHIHDWAIYTQPPHWNDIPDPEEISDDIIETMNLERQQFICNPIQKILKNGDKLHIPKHIRELVPCTEEAYKMYRH